MIFFRKYNKIVFFLIFSISSSYSQVIESGFGSSSLLHLRKGGLDINNDGIADGTYGQVFSQKVVKDNIGKIVESYSIQGISQLKTVDIAKAGDVNSDGMDDIILTFIPIGSNSNKAKEIVVFDGFNGNKLFDYEINDADRYIKDLTVADFNGDARDEIVFITQNKEETALYYVDYFNNIIKKRFFKINSASLFTSTWGDINGDSCDDLLLTYIINENVQNVVAYNIVADEEIFHKRIKISQNKTITKLFIQSNFLDDDIYSETVIGTNYHSLAGQDGYNISIFNNNGEVVNEYSSISEENLSLYALTLVYFDGDKNGEIVYSEKSNENVSKLFYFSLSDHSKREFFISDKQNNDIAFLKTVDVNKDGKAEILFIEDYLDEDLIESRILILGLDKEKLFLYDKTDFNYQLKNTDQIIWSDVGDFNNDGFLDLVLVHNWGKDKNNDGQGDNSLTSIIDIQNSNELFTLHPFDENSRGYGGYRFVVLNNEFSDSEFLKTLNWNSKYSDLSNVEKCFFNKNYQSAFFYLLKIFKTSKKLKAFPGYEAYPCELSRFHDNLKTFSTAVTMEKECFGSLDSGFSNHPTAAGRRLGRIINTFWFRINNDTITLEEFILALKSIFSHLVWSSKDGRFVAGTNHGTIFELNSYIPSVLTLNICKNLDDNHHKNWLTYLDERIKTQLNHITINGVHDEYSYYYTYRVLQAFNNFQGWFNANYNQIDYKYTHSTELILAVERMLNYCIYSVKPIIAIPDKKLKFIDSDIPALGDSRGIFENMFGKHIPDSSYGAFLEIPLKSEFKKYWFDNTLASKLDFVANSLYKTQSDYNLPVTKFFDVAGVFISRSNWLKEDGKTYDNNARYCYFKGGEMIPRPGPYNGFTTSSKHAHADILSVELSAYNRNIIVELGGFANPNSSVLINSFDNNRYTNLYGYDTKFNEFLTVRHYFKGTAAHNTCYVNLTDQAQFIDHYKWEGVDKLYKKTAYHNISGELDYYSAAYHKESQQSYTHRRTMYYIKPKITQKIDNDYWIFSDKIDFLDNSEYSQNRIEQIWHLASSQDSVQFIKDSLTLYTNNMVVISNNNSTFSELIRSYNQTNGLLVDTYTLKFVHENSKKTDQFLTIIFPYKSIGSFSNFHLVETTPSSVAASKNASMYEFSFSKQNGLEQDYYKDYIFISHNKQKSFIFQVNDELKIPTLNSKFIFVRYKNNEKLKIIELKWDNIKQIAGKTEKDFYLEQNYPNPFVSNTVINFKLNKEAKVSLVIYDILGCKIKSLLNKSFVPGKYSYLWDGTDDFNCKVSSGIYLYRLNVNGKIISKKIVKIK